MRLLKIYYFFLTLINVSVIRLVLYIHICLYCFFIICSYFHLLCLLQFTMFHNFITTCPKIKEIKKHFITKGNIIIFAAKYEIFLLSHQITFFLAFGQAKIFLSYEILMTILIYILFFMIKKYLKNN